MYSIVTSDLTGLLVAGCMVVVIGAIVGGSEPR
jgi:hypothetical protein